MYDDFKTPSGKNKELSELVDLTKLWNIAFVKLIIEEGERITNEYLSKPNGTVKKNAFNANMISHFSINNYLSDIKNLN